MKRQEKVMEAALPMFPELFAGSCEKMTNYCRDHSQEMVAELLTALAHVMAQVQELQRSGKKGKVQYIVFSYLLSGIFLKTTTVRIDVMDSGFYADPFETVSYLELAGIYQWFEQDMEVIKKAMVMKVPRLKKYEADMIRYEYITNYHRAAKTFIQAMMEEMETELLLGNVQREKQVQVLFGGYMDKADILRIFDGGEEG